jgi:cobalt/nickel transport system permease protein
VRQTLDDRKAPLMGVLGAFIFAAQMINFAIPGTGSSGHMGGGLILALLLGPHAAFLVIASVLTVQALFFADGGLLALGCNIFNLGFFPALIAYPLVHRPICGPAASGPRFWAGAILAAVVGLQLSAFGAVLETRASGISDLPFRAFVLLMQPIHLAIGLVEGLVTVAVVRAVLRARPELSSTMAANAPEPRSVRNVAIGLLVAAVIVGGALSWFASSHPDGLEWAIGKVTGKEELPGSEAGIQKKLADVQAKTAFLPDYGFKSAEAESATAGEAEAAPEPWPALSAGTSVSGIVGGLITLAVAGVIGLALRKRPALDPHGQR